LEHCKIIVDEEIARVEVELVGIELFEWENTNMDKELMESLIGLARETVKEVLLEVKDRENGANLVELLEGHGRYLDDADLEELTVAETNTASVVEERTVVEVEGRGGLHRQPGLPQEQEQRLAAPLSPQPHAATSATPPPLASQVDPATTYQPGYNEGQPVTNLDNTNSNISTTTRTRSQQNVGQSSSTQTTPNDTTIPRYADLSSYLRDQGGGVPVGPAAGTTTVIAPPAPGQLQAAQPSALYAADVSNYTGTGTSGGSVVIPVRGESIVAPPATMLTTAQDTTGGQQQQQHPQQLPSTPPENFTSGTTFSAGSATIPQLAHASQSVVGQGGLFISATTATATTASTNQTQTQQAALATTGINFSSSGAPAGAAPGALNQQQVLAAQHQQTTASANASGNTNNMTNTSTWSPEMMPQLPPMGLIPTSATAPQIPTSGISERRDSTTWDLQNQSQSQVLREMNDVTTYPQEMLQNNAGTIPPNNGGAAGKGRAGLSEVLFSVQGQQQLQPQQPQQPHQAPLIQPAPAPRDTQATHTMSDGTSVRNTTPAGSPAIHAQDVPVDVHVLQQVASAGSLSWSVSSPGLPPLSGGGGPSGGYGSGGAVGELYGGQAGGSSSLGSLGTTNNAGGSSFAG
ncbi:unnamed protein product, partial [Amoebophrya sp. A120]